MHTPSLSPAASPAALAAFLRGVERRGFLYLWLRCGDAAAAETALAAAMRAFAGQARRLPMAQWPGEFWKRVLAAPLPDASAALPPPLEALSGPAPADARALLLWLTAGLREDEAAAALGDTVERVRQALARACPRAPDGAPDETAWRAMAGAVQQRLRDLPPERLALLERLREAALAPPARTEPAAAPAFAAATPDRRPRRRWPWVLLVAALCAGALAATYRWPGLFEAITARRTEAPPPAPDDLVVRDAPPVRIEALPQKAPFVPDRPPPEPPVLPEELAGWVGEFDFYAWYAAGAPDSRLDHEAAPAGEAPVVVEAIPTTTTDGAAQPHAVDLPDPRHWQAWLRAWRELDPSERAQVQDAAFAFAALPPQEQQALRARYVRLDGMERRGWQLGPRLGEDYPALQPLIGLVPESQREPLLAALRALDPEQRARLARLAHRTPPQGRDALRRELLAVPPARRDAWLRERTGE